MMHITHTKLAHGLAPCKQMTRTRHFLVARPPALYTGSCTSGVTCCVICSALLGMWMESVRLLVCTGTMTAMEPPGRWHRWVLLCCARTYG